MSQEQEANTRPNLIGPWADTDKIIVLDESDPVAFNDKLGTVKEAKENIGLPILEFSEAKAYIAGEQALFAGEIIQTCKSSIPAEAYSSSVWNITGSGIKRTFGRGEFKPLVLKNDSITEFGPGVLNIIFVNNAGNNAIINQVDVIGHFVQLPNILSGPNTNFSSAIGKIIANGTDGEFRIDINDITIPWTNEAVERDLLFLNTLSTSNVTSKADLTPATELVFGIIDDELTLPELTRFDKITTAQFMNITSAQLQAASTQKRIIFNNNAGTGPLFSDYADASPLFSNLQQSYGEFIGNTLVQNVSNFPGAKLWIEDYYPAKFLENHGIRTTHTVISGGGTVDFTPADATAHSIHFSRYSNPAVTDAALPIKFLYPSTIAFKTLSASIVINELLEDNSQVLPKFVVRNSRLPADLVFDVPQEFMGKVTFPINKEFSVLDDTEIFFLIPTDNNNGRRIKMTVYIDETIYAQ